MASGNNETFAIRYLAVLYTKVRIIVLAVDRKVFSIFVLDIDLRIRGKEKKIRDNFCHLPFITNIKYLISLKLHFPQLVHVNSTVTVSLLHLSVCHISKLMLIKPEF